MAAFSSNWLILFPLAFSLYVALRLAEGSVDRQPHRTSGLVVRGLIGVMFCFSLFAVGLRISVLGVLWIGLLGIFAFLIYWKNLRLERSAILLTALNATTPLQQKIVADALKAEHGGWLGLKTAHLRRDVELGVPWFTAVERRRLALGVYEKLAVRLTARYGKRQQLNRGRAVEELGELSPLFIETEAERLLGRLLVLGWLIFLIPILTLFITFILPTFKMLLEEFGVQTPVTLQAVMGLGDAAAYTGGLFLMGLLQLFLIASIALGGLLWTFPALLRLPGVNWFGRDYYRNLGFVALAHAVRHEKDLVAACRATAELVPLPFIAGNYSIAAKLLYDGSSPRDAFLQSRLLSQREYRGFGLAFDHTDPGWCLQQLANWKLTRMLSRYSLLIQLTVIVLTLAAACIVGMVAIGVMETLSSMIFSLTQS